MVVSSYRVGCLDVVNQLDFTQFCPLSCGALWYTHISPLSLLLWSVCVVHCDYSPLDKPTVVVTCDIPVDVMAEQYNQYRLIVGGQRLSILSLWFLLWVAAVLIACSLSRGTFT